MSFRTLQRFFSTRPIDAARRIAICLELGLDAAVLIFLPLLVLAPLGVAPLASIAGVLGFGLVRPHGMVAIQALRLPAALLGALVLWATLSAAWSLVPVHSLLTSGGLLGISAAGLALLAASDALVSPRRLLYCFCAGLIIALVLAEIQFATAGLLTRPFVTRDFSAPELNQATDPLAILVLPAAATLFYLGRAGLAVLLAAATLTTIYGLVGTAAKTALGAGVLFAGLLYCSPRAIARLAAILSVLVIITAPLSFSRIVRLEGVVKTAEWVKFSAWHRLMIWSFAGDRIAEHPLSGWGLDASRAIPGGNEPVFENRVLLPLHPHNAALQTWLELGVPGATLFALIAARLWLGLAAAPWPRLFAATAGASLMTAFVAATVTYGLWQEWWIATLWFSLFLVLVMARCVQGRTPRLSAG
jgi:O-antigen ligase